MRRGTNDDGSTGADRVYAAALAARDPSERALGACADLGETKCRHVLGRCGHRGRGRQPAEEAAFHELTAHLAQPHELRPLARPTHDELQGAG